MGPSMGVRMVEPEVKALTPADAAQVFAALREKVLASGSFTAEPKGFSELSMVAKHHTLFQRELIGLVSESTSRPWASGRLPGGTRF